MAQLKFVLLLACLVYSAQALFPKALQQRWGYMDTSEFAAANPKVVGGSEAAQGEAPFQSSMLRDYIILKSHICGGSLITPQTILTAAHSSSLINRLGTNQRSKPGIPDIKTQRIVQHAGYNPDTIENDIALLILASPVTPSATVNIIELESQDLIGGEEVKVYGWGKTDGTVEALPENLQVGNLKIVSHSECNAKWQSENPIALGMICALAQNTQACNGDSGGPLVYNGKLAGVVSWGPKNCPPGEYMAVFSSPKYFLDWINANKA